MEDVHLEVLVATHDDNVTRGGVELQMINILAGHAHAAKDALIPVSTVESRPETYTERQTGK